MVSLKPIRMGISSKSTACKPNPGDDYYQIQAVWQPDEDDTGTRDSSRKILSKLGTRVFPNVLCACKLIYGEAALIPYLKNSFKFDIKDMVFPCGYPSILKRWGRGGVGKVLRGDNAHMIGPMPDTIGSENSTSPRQLILCADNVHEARTLLNSAAELLGQIPTLRSVEIVVNDLSLKDFQEGPPACRSHFHYSDCDRFWKFAEICSLRRRIADFSYQLPWLAPLNWISDWELVDGEWVYKRGEKLTHLTRSHGSKEALPKLPCGQYGDVMRDFDGKVWEVAELMDLCPTRDDWCRMFLGR